MLLALPLRAFADDEMFEGPLGIPHARDASGTAWQPDATPMNAVHFMSDDWMFMVHGLAFAGWDYQATRRGNDLLMSANWGMLMAQRELLGGELTLRTHALARARDGRARRLSAAAAERRGAARRAAARPPAPARSVHGARRALPPRGDRRRRRRALPRALGRAGARPAGVLAPALRVRQPVRADQPSLAGLDAHQLRRRHGRAVHALRQARGVVVQRPRARREPLGPRPAQPGLVLDPAQRQPDRRGRRCRSRAGDSTARSSSSPASA